MRFKIFLILLSLGVVANATTLTSFFEANKNDILSEQITEGEGYVFGVAHVRPLTTSANSWKNAEKRSILLAQGNVLQRVALSKLVWPKSISVEQQHIIAEAYMRTQSLFRTVHQMRVLCQVREENGWVTVVALPIEESNRFKKVTFSELREKMLASETIFGGVLPIETLIVLRATQDDMPKEIDRTPWLSSLDQAHFETYHLKRLPALAGRYPIGTCEPIDGEYYQRGMQAYQQGDLLRAYEAFLAEAEKSLAYDALNMAGNVARRIGKLNEAVPLLLHAAYLKPTSSHPWVHLAFVAEHLGSLEVMACCIAEAEMRNPDTWSREQITILRERVQTLITVKSTDGLPQENGVIE